MAAARYDTIGTGDAATRREDPDLRARIHTALGASRSVVDVGAGAGSYEPHDRLRGRDRAERRDGGAAHPGLAPAVRASAAALPLRDDAVDAAWPCSRFTTGTTNKRAVCASCAASPAGPW